MIRIPAHSLPAAPTAHDSTRVYTWRMAPVLAFSALVALPTLLIGCQPASQGPSRDHRASSQTNTNQGAVDPKACGNYREVDAGRKLYAFLEATVRLDRAVRTTEDALRNTCAMMASELSIPATGTTEVLCKSVANTIQSNLSTGMSANARLDLDYQPAVCTVDIDVAARAAAECQARAQADIEVRCEGTCRGTCSGQCDGTCTGAAGASGAGAGAAGACDGTCEGRCQGTCSGGCDGHADVQADASCEAKAEIDANVQATCTEPEVKVDARAEVVVDPAKIQATMRALRRGLPRILMIQARMSGPVMSAFRTWSRASAELVASGPRLVEALGGHAVCVLGQVAGAAAAVSRIKVSVEVQVEVSAQVSASAGGGARTR